MNSDSKKIFISAGEESGDLQGGNLVRTLKELRPDLEFRGLGGKKMRHAGVDSFFEIDRLGGLGLTGVLGGFFHHLEIYRKLKEEIQSGQYRAAILIHYPMFNLLLAKVCRQCRVPAFFFISPQVWASRKRRIRSIRRTIKKMYVILPFEQALYEKAGVPVEFVGHPFLDLARPALSKEEALKTFGLDPDKPVVGLLPGSRKGEVIRLLPVMVQAASRIKKEIPDCQFLLPIADAIDPMMIRKGLQNSSVEITTATGKGYDAMNCMDFALCASGSATLELGLFGCPMAVAYRFNPVTFWSLRWFVNVESFALINIVAGEKIVPELLQHEVTPERLANEALAVLQDPARKDALRARLLEVRKTLGEPGVARRLANSLLKEFQLAPGDEKISI